MRETYITRMPNHTGVFRQVCEIIARCHGNITRVNYNMGVDAGTVFIEVSGEEEQLAEIRGALTDAGYLSLEEFDRQVILVDIELPDTVGAIVPILEIISARHINISFVNYHQSDGLTQHIRLGLFMEHAGELEALLEQLSAVCKVTVCNYEVTDRSLDITVFYETFAHELRDILTLSEQETYQILVQSNRIMQMLDEGNQDHLKTFDYIRRFAQFIRDHKGEGFRTTISRMELEEGLTLHIIEPPCGSNTYILEEGRELLFVDCGFACYREEMLRILTGLFPDFQERSKRLLLTHADIDHAGILNMFDVAYMAGSCMENFEDEWQKKPNFREQNLLHQPYCMISKIITGYTPPDLSRCEIIGVKKDSRLLSSIGSMEFAGHRWLFYEGLGGHVRGETVIACPELSLVFTGDIYVNIREFSEDQRAFNLLAPYLMTRVDEDSAVARQTRSLLLEKYQNYLLCPGHGPVVDGRKRQSS